MPGGLLVPVCLLKSADLSCSLFPSSVSLFPCTTPRRGCGAASIASAGRNNRGCRLLHVNEISAEILAEKTAKCGVRIRKDCQLPCVLCYTRTQMRCEREMGLSILLHGANILEK